MINLRRNTVSKVVIKLWKAVKFKCSGRITINDRLATTKNYESINIWILNFFAGRFEIIFKFSLQNS